MQSKKNARAAIAMAAIIVCVAVASWFYLEQMGFGSSKGYKNVTFTDALIECQDFTRERYGESLQRLTFDAHSSRWDQRKGHYLVFFTAEMSSGQSGGSAVAYYIACDVSGRSGTVRDFDALENKEHKTEAQRKNDGGLFGWP